MPTYEIDGPDGKTYEIDGPPGATRDQIIAKVQAGLGASQAAPQPQPEKPGWLADSIRAIPGGLAKGVAGVVGLPGDVRGLMDQGADWAMGKLGVPASQIEAGRNKRESIPLQAATSSGLNSAISTPFGGYYKPQTTAGKYAETISSFAPSALAPGSALARVSRVAVPGAASEAAGQAAEGTGYEGLARAGGALAGGLAVGWVESALSKGSRPPIPTGDDLRTQANALYKEADNAGIAIAPDSYSNLVDDISAAVKDAGTHPKLHPKVAGVLESLQEAKGSALPLGDLERLRRIAKGAASSIEPDERRVASVIVDKLDDFTDGLTQSDVVSGDPKAAGLLSEARGIWAKFRKSETIDNLIERAKNRATTQNGNVAASLRAEFQALLKNKKAMRGFSPEEVDAIKKVARVGPVSGTLAALGAMRPRGLVGAIQAASGGTAAVMAANPLAAVPAITAAGIGQGSQWGLNALTKSNALRAGDLMRAGPGLLNQAPSISTNKLLLDGLLSQAAHR